MGFHLVLLGPKLAEMEEEGSFSSDISARIMECFRQVERPTLIHIPLYLYTINYFNLVKSIFPFCGLSVWLQVNVRTSLIPRFLSSFCSILCNVYMREKSGNETVV